MSATESVEPPPKLERGSPLTKVVSRPVRVKPRLPLPSSPKLAGAPMVVKQVGEPLAKPVLDSESSAPTTTRVPPQEKPSVLKSQAYPTAKPVASKPVPAKPRPGKTGHPKPSESDFPDSPKGWGKPVPKTGQPTGGGEGGTQSTVTRRAMPVEQPEFNLTARFPELKSVKVKAEFKINKDGSYEPTLLTGSGNPTADVVILAKLLEYKWLPAMEKGVPIEDTRVLQIRLDG